MRGQSAMEFLMTYGWAVFAMLAAIAVIAYFGVAPSGWLPNKCTVQAPFTCREYLVRDAAEDNVRLFLQNSWHDVLGMDVRLSCADGTSAVPLTSNSRMVRAGELMIVNFTCPHPTAREHWRGNFSIVYNVSGETVSHVVIGTLSTKVER